MKISRKFSLAFLIAIGTSLTFIPIATANIPSLKAKQTIAQASQEQLDRQRETEKVLKQGENLRQDIRNRSNFDNNRPDLENKTKDQIDRVRESGGDPQKVKDAQGELDRLREDNNRRPAYYQQPFYPVFYPSYYNNTPFNSAPTQERRDVVGQDSSGNSPTATPSKTRVWASAGFRDGSISPGVGVQFGKSIGVEVAGIFNQDNFPGGINNFSLPSNLLFTNLGVKKLGPQLGADVLGFIDVAPNVAAYGSVGVYFQSVGQVAQSQSTNEFYKQTNETNVSGAVGLGATYQPSEDVSVGLGYHSLRGATVRVGVSF